MQREDKTIRAQMPRIGYFFHFFNLSSTRLIRARITAHFTSVLLTLATICGQRVLHRHEIVCKATLSLTPYADTSCVAHKLISTF